MTEIISAFSDSTFQEEIKRKRDEIEAILNEFISTQCSLPPLKAKISTKINSRIKTEESLKEKLKRKDYISVWETNEKSEKDIQKIICEKLPDLIGFRINCYFKNDESHIFSKLIDYLGKKDSIDIEKHPNTKQKNGHDIFKVACKYKDSLDIFSFEVQVKSLLNDVWGEVEHSIIYKSKSYDSRENLKTDIIDGIYTILDGADKQLNKLYSFNISTKEIKRELFYKYSNEELKCYPTILRDHYNNFFKLISFIENNEESIDIYLGKKLLKEDYSKIEITDISKSDIEISNYKNNFDLYKWEIFCQIANILYEYKTEDILLKHLISRVQDIATIEPDEFSDQGESINDDEIMESFSCIRKTITDEKEKENLC